MIYKKVKESKKFQGLKKYLHEDTPNFDLEHLKLMKKHYNLKYISKKTTKQKLSIELESMM